MWTFDNLGLKGAALITMPSFADSRGGFVKTFHKGVFLEQGIDFELKESYFSISGKDVIRGMHFQLPPHDHAKIVFCPQGAILDVIVDLRKSSPTYGHYAAHVLSAADHNGYYIPQGFAHGFKALTEGAMTYYLVSSVYEPQHDTGIRWDSFGFDWQTVAPVMSSRDMSFIGLQEFKSPF